MRQMMRQRRRQMNANVSSNDAWGVFFPYPPVIKHGNGKSPMNRDLIRNITDKWSIFQPAMLDETRGYRFRFLRGLQVFRLADMTRSGDLDLEEPHGATKSHHPVCQQMAVFCCFFQAKSRGKSSKHMSKPLLFFLGGFLGKNCCNSLLEPGIYLLVCHVLFFGGAPLFLLVEWPFPSQAGSDGNQQWCTYSFHTYYGD